MKRKVGCGVLGVLGLLVLGVMVARQPAAVPVPTLSPERAATVVLPPATVAPGATSAAFAPPTPSAMSDAKLYSGPGTNYPVVGSVAAGEALAVIGQNEKGDWYQLKNGQWISIDMMLNAPYADVVSEMAADTCERCIKGNISEDSGERIFHVPGCDNYEETDVDEAIGERWFSSEAEAIAAGWRKAQNCP